MKVSGLDVHKDSIFCGIYNGKDQSEVKEYTTLTTDIKAMGLYLKAEGVKKIYSIQIGTRKIRFNNLKIIN